MKSLLKKFNEFFAKGGPLALTLSVVLSVLMVTGLIEAASTISTNISTGGTLSVVGQSTLGGQASTTRLSVNETAYFGGAATTTIGIGGNITGGGTLAIYGQSTLGGQASTTRLSVNETAYFGGAATTTIGIGGNITGGGTLAIYGQSTLGGQASTTRLSVNETAYFGGTATTTFSKAGNITSGTTNSATTTLIIGCIQMYATSTDTAIRLEFGVGHMASTTFRTGGSTAGGSNQSGGQVVWVYGTCP